MMKWKFIDINIQTQENRKIWEHIRVFHYIATAIAAIGPLQLLLRNGVSPRIHYLVHVGLLLRNGDSFSTGATTPCNTTIDYISFKN
jgi:hypothetical protein